MDLLPKDISVTIGLPTLNARPYLELALRSIFAQSRDDWELIAIDDGSKDGSAEIIQSLRDPRVRVIVDGRHLGLGARLNQITALARGRYIARMDADDLMHPDRLHSQIAYLDQNPRVDAVGCAMVILGDSLTPVGIRCLPPSHHQICKHPLRGFLIAHASLCARAAWFREHQYDETLVGCEDWALFLGAFRSSTFANLPTSLYYYREWESYSLNKYVAAKLGAVTFLVQHARPQFGWFRTTLAAGAQRARAEIYKLCAHIGLERTLLRARNSLSKTSRGEFDEVMQKICSTSLPGVDAQLSNMP